MNSYYVYDHFALWQDEVWEDRISHVSGLINELGRIQKLNGGGYRKPDWDEAAEQAHYQSKTGSVDDPAVLDRLLEWGLTVRILDMTEHWIAVVPTWAMGRKDTLLPVLVTCLQADYNDSYWAMKTLTEYAAYQEAALRENWIVLYVVSNNGPDLPRTYVNIIQEAAALFPCDTKRLWLDVNPVLRAGKSLSEIEDFSLLEADGSVVMSPEQKVTTLWDGSVSALPIAGSWEHRGSLGRDLVMSDKYSLGDFDRERLLHSATAKHMMQGIRMEYQYDTVYDAALKAELEDRGLDFCVHVSKGERWLTLAPKNALEQPEEKLPLFCVMQEVYPGNEHLAVTALAYFEELLELASQGECILLFFVLEDPDSNDLLTELIDEAAGQYPVDLRRVYLTGHSHDGRFALEFSVRNWRRVAAVATLGNFMGMEGTAQALSEERIRMMSGMDLPCVNLCGCKEHGGKLPVNVDARTLALRPGQEYGRTIELEKRLDAWQKRLMAWNCPIHTREELLAAANSDNTVEREMGFPVDRSEILFAEGFNHYIADLKNRNGQYHLRMVALENMPHVPTPVMLELAWDFVRRFARNLETGEIVELY